MAIESDTQLITGGSGALIRTVNVTTIINGLPTVVQMEVAAISDTNGNPWFPPADIYDQILSVLKQIRQGIALLLEATGQTLDVSDLPEIDEDSQEFN